MDKEAEPFKETLLASVNLRDHPHEVPIYSGEPPEPIDSDRAGITLSGSAGRESFNLVFYTSAGVLLERLPYETLEIAHDQAYAIADIPRSEWEPCEIDFTVIITGLA